MDFTVWPAKSNLMTISPRVRESGFCNLGNFCVWIRSTAQGIRNTTNEKPTIGIQNPSSIEKDWNPVPGILNPQRGIQNPRPSWIPLHWASNDWYGMNKPVADPREGPRGSAPLIFDQIKALRVCMTAPLPYLKVWIRQCRPCLLRCFVAHLGHSIQEMGSIVWNTFIIMLLWTLHFQREKGIKSLRNIRLLINLG